MALVFQFLAKVGNPEAMHMIQKGQIRWVSGTDVHRQIQFIKKIFEVAA